MAKRAEREPTPSPTMIAMKETLLMTSKKAKGLFSLRVGTNMKGLSRLESAMVRVFTIIPVAIAMKETLLRI